MTRRIKNLLLVLIFVGAGGYYVQEHRSTMPTPSSSSSMPASHIDQSASLGLDDEVKANIHHYMEGVTLATEQDNLAQAIQLDHAVGRPQISRGEYREAYRTYQQVLSISYRHGNLMGVGIALTMMADISHRAKDLDEALFTTLLAYRVAEAMKNSEEMGVVELAFSRLLQDRDPSLSVMWLLRAKDHLEGSRYREDYVRALPRLAAGLIRLGDHEEASKLYAEAWAQSQVLGNQPAQQWTKTEVADGYARNLARANRHEQAIEVLQRAETFFMASEKATDRYTAVLHNLARSYAALKNSAEAGRYYNAAYANYELTRANEPGEDARARLDTDHSPLVNEFVTYQLQAGNLAGALALLESNKARTLQDVFGDPLYQHSQEQWHAMERRQSKETADFWAQEGDALLSVSFENRSREYVGLAAKHDQERRQLQVTLQLTEMVAIGSLSPSHIDELARDLPSDTAVLSFFFNHGHVSAFVVTQTGVRHLPLLVDAEECRRTIQQLRVTLTNPHNDLYREPAQWLFQRLVGPAIQAIPKTVKTLIYSPDGILSRIPLEVLMDGEHFLAESYGIYRVPSLRYATAVRAVKAVPVRQGIACVDPDIAGARLPFQQETGQLLKQLYGNRVTVLVGKDCTEGKLVNAIQNQRRSSFLHIGAHGNFYPVHAMDSAIWLSSEDGSRRSQQEWNAKAMATVAMRTVDLVTLSSCETGLTDPVVPRDVFGIERALFFAGAKTIVAPLWSVHDRATAEFMRTFHTAYQRDLPAVMALQHAQRALMQTPSYQHPFYWAAFVLTGAAR